MPRTRSMCRVSRRTTSTSNETPSTWQQTSTRRPLARHHRDRRESPLWAHLLLPQLRRPAMDGHSVSSTRIRRRATRSSSTLLRAIPEARRGRSAPAAAGWRSTVAHLEQPRHLTHRLARRDQIQRRADETPPYGHSVPYDLLSRRSSLEADPTVVVAAVVCVDTDRVARATGKLPQRVRERVSVAPALHLIGGLRPDQGAVQINAATDDVVITRGRPCDRDARTVGGRDLDRADSIGSSPTPSGKTRLTPDREQSRPGTWCNSSTRSLATQAAVTRGPPLCLCLLLLLIEHRVQ